MSGLQVERRGGEVWWTLNRPDVRNALDDALIATMRDEARAAGRAMRPCACWCWPVRARRSARAPTSAWMRRMRDYDEQRNLDDARRRGGHVPCHRVAADAGGRARARRGARRRRRPAGRQRHRRSPPTTRRSASPRRGSASCRRRSRPTSSGASASPRHARSSCGRTACLPPRRTGSAWSTRSARSRISTRWSSNASARSRSERPPRTGRPRRCSRELAPLPGAAERRLTAEAIARQRVSDDGQEGLRAFLERRTPSWQSRGPSSA